MPAKDTPNPNAGTKAPDVASQARPNSKRITGQADAWYDAEAFRSLVEAHRRRRAKR